MSSHRYSLQKTPESQFESSEAISLAVDIQFHFSVLYSYTIRRDLKRRCDPMLSNITLRLGIGVFRCHCQYQAIILFVSTFFHVILNMISRFLINTEKKNRKEYCVNSDVPLDLFEKGNEIKE